MTSFFTPICQFYKIKYPKFAHMYQCYKTFALRHSRWRARQIFPNLSTLNQKILDSSIFFGATRNGKKVKKIANSAQFFLFLVIDWLIDDSAPINPIWNFKKFSLAGEQTRDLFAFGLFSYTLPPSHSLRILDKPPSPPIHDSTKYYV